MLIFSIALKQESLLKNKYANKMFIFTEFYVIRFSGVHKLETESNSREKFKSTLKQFAVENDLEKGHEKLIKGTCVLIFKNLAVNVDNLLLIFHFYISSLFFILILLLFKIKVRFESLS